MCEGFVVPYSEEIDACATSVNKTICFILRYRKGVMIYSHNLLGIGLPRDVWYERVMYFVFTVF